MDKGRGRCEEDDEGPEGSEELGGKGEEERVRFIKLRSTCRFLFINGNGSYLPTADSNDLLTAADLPKGVFPALLSPYPQPVP